MITFYRQLILLRYTCITIQFWFVETSLDTIGRDVRVEWSYAGSGISITSKFITNMNNSRWFVAKMQLRFRRRGMIPRAREIEKSDRENVTAVNCRCDNWEHDTSVLNVIKAKRETTNTKWSRR